MTNFVRAYLDRASLPTDDAGPVVFIASTEGRKKDGYDLRMEDWALDRFLQHPVVLYAHDYMGRNLPIGTGDPYFEERRLMMRVQFDSEDEFAMRVRQKTIKGMMGGSVGWDDVKNGDGRVRRELLEFSIVPVPLDSDSLPVMGARALDLATEYANLDDSTAPCTDDDLWPHVAAAMAAVMRPAGALDDAARKRVYVGLERVYSLFGREAPEFRTLAELDALGEAELRGLFLEGELDLAAGVRAGAVLNKRNRDALTQAQSLIQSVLDSAKKPDEGSDEDESGRCLAEALARLQSFEVRK